MLEALTQFQLEYGYQINPLIVGTLVSIVCSVVGCFIVLRGMSFLADAIAHSMLAGVIAGYLFMLLAFGQESHLGGMLIGATLAGIVTVAMVGLVTRFSRIKQDTAIGIMYTGIFAMGSFLLSLNSIGRLVKIDIYHFIVGDVIAVTSGELWLLAIVTSIVLSVVILFYRPLQLTSFDPIMAASIGIPVLAVEYLLTACTSLVVVSGVQIAGVILVVALIITPAASAYLLTDRLDRMIVTSAILGVIGFWVGFLIANLTGSAAGAAVVITMTAIFFLCLVFAPQYGLLADWIRKRNTVPQEIMEDVLGSVMRGPDDWISIDKVLRYIKKPNKKIRKSIDMLERQGLLEVRAHRLWETYLDQTSVPKEEIHNRAHQLEHLQDQSMVDYLDDKLGHPITDPHGSEIPLDEKRINTAGNVLLAWLREGYRAKIVEKRPCENPVAIQVGDIVSIGERSEDGMIWTVITASGAKLELDHDQADSLLVAVQERD